MLKAKSDHAGPRLMVAPRPCPCPGIRQMFVIGDLVGRDKLPGVAQDARCRAQVPACRTE